MKNKIRTFLQNAYGFDQFSQHLYYVGIAIFVISMFVRSNVLRITSLIIILYSLYRSLSQKRSKRARELVLYRRLTRNVRVKFKVFFLNIKDREYKYFVCKSCGQQLRVPRKKGKIEITCSRCRHKFDVKL